MKQLLILSASIIFLISCGNKKEIKKPSYGKPTTQKKVEQKVDKNQKIIAQGKELFQSKTCFTCHQVDKKVIGPSIKTITSIYKKENASILSFLQSKSEPIVDTNPGQVAVMKANLNSFVKAMTEEELKAIEAYMNSI